MTLQAGNAAGMMDMDFAQARPPMGVSPAAGAWSNFGTRGLALLGGGAAVLIVDMIVRNSCPAVARDIVPLVAFGGGVLLAWHRARQPPTRRLDTESVKRLHDTTIAQVAPLAIDPSPSPIDMATSSLTNLGPIDTIAESNAAPSVSEAATPLDLGWAVSQLSQYHLFTEILNSQLVSVTDLTEKAAHKILMHLTDIDGQVTTLVDFIKTSGSNDQAEQVVRLIESQMKGCQDLLDRFAVRQKADSEESRKQRAKIAAETCGVLDVLDGVDGIARHTTILSFNVSIEAARAGEVGRGFMVIGDEIRKLAAEVRSLAKDARERVETLMRTVTVDLQQKAEQREQAEREALGHIGKTLGALTDNLTTLITHQRAILSKVESENEAIARPLMQVMGSIQFQDIVRQQLEQLVQMSAMVDEHLRSVGERLKDPQSDIDLKDLSGKVDDLYGRYVMDRQRKTHRAAQGQAVAPPAAARIELF